ncbi:helix-turn-helix domain-containing protein [Gottfriedia acidiceleris]|uniref:helix-turn-helix domain-containing protein n=1 Tax=Gottfriedia acidiceleris TaxID=371036 RepID=UPI003D20B688
MIENNFRSNIQFASYLDVNRAVIQFWIKGTRKPTLQSLFQICKKLNLSIYELVCLDLDININFQKPSMVRSGIKLKDLEYVINNNYNNGLFKLSREHSFDERTAKKNFPILSKKISDIYLKQNEKILNHKKTR